MSHETLPDVLERDCVFTPSATNRGQKAIDELRDRLADAVDNLEKYFDIDCREEDYSGSE